MKSKIIRLINLLARFLVSVILSYWGFKVLYPVEPFESRIVEQGVASWYVAPLLVRLTIGLQWIISLFFILNFKPRLLKVFLAVWLLLCGWDIIWELQHQNKIVSECYGCILKYNTAVSIALYVLVLGGGIIILLQKNTNGFKPQWIKHIIWPPLLVLPFILNPVYPSGFSDQAQKSNEPFDFEKIDSVTAKKLRDKNLLLAFFSPNCKFCKQAAQRMTISSLQNPNFPKVFILFTGNENGVQYFKLKSHDPFDYSIIDSKEFWKMSGPRLPSFAWIENDTIRKRWDGYTFNYYTVANLR